MKGRPYFNNFSGGELDPRMHARTDLEEYHSSVKTAKNMVARTQGPLQSRGGTRLVSIITTDQPTCKFLKQQRGAYEAVCLYTRDASGAIVARTQWFSLTGGLNPPSANIEDGMLLTVGHAAVTIDEDTYNGGIEWYPGQLRMFTTFDKGTLAIQTVRFTIASLPTSNSAIVSLKLADIFVADANTTVTVKVGETVAAAENIVVEVDIDNTNTCVLQVAFNAAATDIFVEVTLASDLEREISIISINEAHHGTGHASNWTTPADVTSIRACVDVSVNGNIACHPLIPPKRHVWDGTGATSTGDVSFTSKPAEWVVGNYPTICAFFGGRSWWSGCQDNPTRIWSSRVNTAVAGDWFDMTTGSLATDAIDIIRDRPGRITNIVSGPSLLVLTDRDSFLLGATGGVLTPADTQEVLQSGVGAASIDPVELGAIVIYVAADRRRIMVTRYVENINAWRDTQANANAIHLFENKSIQRLEYLDNEVQQLFVLFTDGTLVIGVKDSLSELFGWSSVTYNLRVGDIVSFYRAGKTYLLLASYGPIAVEQAAIEVYEPDYALDHIQEFFAESGATSLFYDPFSIYMYTAVNYAIREIPDVVIAHGSDYWTSTQGTVYDGWFTLDGTPVVNLYTQPANGWEVGYRPAYCLVTFIHSELLEFAIGVVGGLAVVRETLGSGAHVLELDWAGNESNDIAFGWFLGENPASDGGVFCLAFSDSKDALERVQQFYRVKTNDDTEWRYLGHGPFDMNTAYELGDGAINYFISGVPIDKEVETLEPFLPTPTGSGRSTIRGKNKVHVGLRDSVVPEVNAKVPKVDGDADVNSDGTIASGYVRGANTGYTRNMSTVITHNEPGRLEVSEIILDITQSEDG